MKNMNIQSLNIFHQKALIAGEWQEANNGNTIEGKIRETSIG